MRPDKELFDMLLKCENCKKYFAFNLRHKAVGCKVELFYTCSHCKSDFHNYFEDDATLQLAYEISDTISKLTDLDKNETKYDICLNKIKLLQAQRKKVLKILNGREAKKKQGLTDLEIEMSKENIKQNVIDRERIDLDNTNLQIQNMITQFENDMKYIEVKVEEDLDDDNNGVIG